GAASPDAGWPPLEHPNRGPKPASKSRNNFRCPGARATRAAGLMPCDGWFTAAGPRVCVVPPKFLVQTTARKPCRPSSSTAGATGLRCLQGEAGADLVAPLARVGGLRGGVLRLHPRLRGQLGELPGATNRDGAQEHEQTETTHRQAPAPLSGGFKEANLLRPQVARE